MLELQSVSTAFNRVELIYDQKNPFLQRFLTSAQKDKNNLYTADIDEILNLTSRVIDSIDKSIDELEKLEVKIPNSKLITTTTDYLKNVNEYEKDMPEFLKLVTDSIENNHLEIRKKISISIEEVNLSRSVYQKQLDNFYSKNNFSKREIDSLIGNENEP